MNVPDESGLSVDELAAFLNPESHVRGLLADGENLDPDSARLLLLQIARLLLDGDELPEEARRFLGHAFWSIALDSVPPKKALRLERPKRGRSVRKGKMLPGIQGIRRDQKYLGAFLSAEWLDCGDRPEEVVNDAISEAAKNEKVSKSTIRRAVARRAPTFMVLREFSETMGPVLGLNSHAEALEYLLETYRRS